MSDPTLDALTSIYVDVVSRDRFRDWRRELDATVLDGYAVGQIHWKTGIGRPNTATLAEGFGLVAFQEQWVRAASEPGTVRFERWPRPRSVSLWDGTSDEENWRVAFMVDGLVDGRTQDARYNLYTQITPSLKSEVPWTMPGGDYGIATTGARVISPRGAYFVKENSVVHLEFEVELISFLRVGRDGVVGP